MLYFQQWNETKFVDVATRLAIQSLANRERVQRLAKEIVRRSDQILPVSQNTLHDPRLCDLGIHLVLEGTACQQSATTPAEPATSALIADGDLGL